jgi:stage V sporulation protein SpoVS
MANSDNALGGRPIRQRNGAPYSGAGSLYHVDSAHAGIIAPGDPVVVTGTADTLGIPDVDIATAGATNLITGFVIGRTNGEGTLLQDDSLVLPVTTEGYLLVEDNPDVVFEMQMSGGFAVGDVSEDASLVAGVAVLGKSKWQVDSGTIGAGATNQVKILRVVRRVDNEVGVNAKVEVMVNQHTQTAGTAGV